VQERVSCPVLAVRRDAEGVDVDTRQGRERFDHVVMAGHSDDMLALLHDADARERDVLGAIRYQSNDTVLHTDARLLPRNRKAWAAWNAHVPRDPSAPCTVSYCMNLLQDVPSPAPFVVTLNRSEAIDPAHILRRMRYRHPVYDQAMVAAQARKGEIQGHRRTWFAGAYWGWGFHEDGIRSARALVDAFEAQPPTTTALRHAEAVPA
jgi:predicted NAD/FAD-binding protein